MLLAPNLLFPPKHVETCRGQYDNNVLLCSLTNGAPEVFVSITIAGRRSRRYPRAE